MLTAAKARDIVQESIDENWTPGGPGRLGSLDTVRFWHSFEAKLQKHLDADAPVARYGPPGIQTEELLGMAGLVLLCWSFRLWQAKAIWHGGPHPQWRAMLEWMRTHLEPLLVESRNFGAEQKRVEQATRPQDVPPHVVIPGPFLHWRDPVL